MRKQCTNSACRRSFSTVGHGGKCPWCGKEYPRITTGKTLVLYSFGTIKLYTVKAVRKLANIGLAEAKRLVELAAPRKPVWIPIEKIDGIGEAKELLKEAGAKYRLPAE